MISQARTPGFRRCAELEDRAHRPLHVPDPTERKTELQAPCSHRPCRAGSHSPRVGPSAKLGTTAKSLQDLSPDPAGQWPPGGTVEPAQLRRTGNSLPAAGPLGDAPGFCGESSLPSPSPACPRQDGGGSYHPGADGKVEAEGGPAPGLGTPTSGLLHPYWAFQLPRGLSGEGERRLHVRTRKPGLRSSKTHEGGSSWDARLWGPRCHCDRHHAGLGGCAPLSTLSTAHKDAAGRTLSCDDGNGRRGTAGRQPVSELWTLTAVPRSVLRGPWSRPWSPRLARGQHWLLPTFP